MEPDSAKFIVIPPRHRRALEMLREQKQRDLLGSIGRGALRDEDDPFTLEQIAEPLLQRGLIEDLTWTDLGAGGKYFVRITRLGEICLGLGYMLRETRKTTLEEMKLLSATARAEVTLLPAATAERLAKHDASDEKEAIA
jgi:hypothetical protein